MHKTLGRFANTLCHIQCLIKPYSNFQSFPKWIPQVPQLSLLLFSKCFPTTGFSVLYMADETSGWAARRLFADGKRLRTKCQRVDEHREWNGNSSQASDTVGGRPCPIWTRHGQLRRNEEVTHQPLPAHVGHRCPQLAPSSCPEHG